MMYNNQGVGAIKVNGKVLREVSPGKVILPFDSEYSVYFKNLSNRSSLVKVTIDGEDVLNGNALVVRSNDYIDLERFYSTKNKFKFIKMTDKIENNRGIKAEDGIVRIEYQFEKEKPQHVFLKSNNWNNYFFNSDYSNIRVGGYTADNTVYGGSSMVCNSTVDRAYTAKSCSSSIGEAGFTTKGSESKQNFSYSYIGELESEKYSICLYLTGSDRVLTVKDNNICNICGTENTYKAKYCSECGTYISIL